MSPPTFIVDVNQVTWRRLDDEIVVFDVVDGDLRVLGGAAAILWPAIARGATIDDLADALVREYEVDVETARNDAAEFVASAVANCSIIRLESEKS
jgi:Coenzyme PQQ synthesis protein D (PqqD)